MAVAPPDMAVGNVSRHCQLFPDWGSLSYRIGNKQQWEFQFVQLTLLSFKFSQKLWQTRSLEKLCLDGCTWHKKKVDLSNARVSSSGHFGCPNQIPLAKRYTPLIGASAMTITQRCALLWRLSLCQMGVPIMERLQHHTPLSGTNWFNLSIKPSWGSQTEASSQLRVETCSICPLLNILILFLRVFNQ